MKLFSVTMVSRIQFHLLIYLLLLRFYNKLTFTTPWANSADNKLMIFFLFFPEDRLYHFMQIFSLEDNLHEKSAYFLGKIKKKYFKMLSAEIFTQHAYSINE